MRRLLGRPVGLTWGLFRLLACLETCVLPASSVQLLACSAGVSSSSSAVVMLKLTAPLAGELHNNVRMTWGKAFLQWAPSPEAALR